MKTLARSQLARLLAGVALTLSANALLAPAVQASCGDYVVREGDVSHARQAHSMLGGMQPGPAHTPANPIKPHAPCSGPLCSRSPLPLQAPVPPPPSVQGEEWGFLPFSPPRADAGSLPRLVEDDALRPVRPVGSVYHPPR